MLSDDFACNQRNSHKGTMFSGSTCTNNEYKDLEVDYKGKDVTVHNLLKVLSDNEPNSPIGLNQRLLSHENSSLLIYLGGHGGDGFLKFQDKEELTTNELRLALLDMYLKGRYNDILLMVDTCQASTLYEDLNAPNVVMMSSSIRGESSYSLIENRELGVSVMDVFTHVINAYFDNYFKPDAPLSAFLNYCVKNQQKSTISYSHTMSKKLFQNKKVSDFFGVQPTYELM